MHICIWRRQEATCGAVRIYSRGCLFLEEESRSKCPSGMWMSVSAPQTICCYQNKATGWQKWMQIHFYFQNIDVLTNLLQFACNTESMTAESKNAKKKITSRNIFLSVFPHVFNAGSRVQDVWSKQLREWLFWVSHHAKIREKLSRFKLRTVLVWTWSLIYRQSFTILYSTTWSVYWFMWILITFLTWTYNSMLTKNNIISFRDNK